MTELAFMMMNWRRFFNSAKVQRLPDGERRAMWALLLGKMWLNDGWIKADDRIVAKALDIDIRRWRAHYKPLLEPLLRREMWPVIGEVYTQKTLTDTRLSALEVVAKNKARPVRARAAKAAKARRAQSVTEPKSAPVTETATTTVDPPVAATQPNKDRALPLKKAERSIQPKSQDLSASSGEIVASGLPLAAVASPGLEGGSLPPPSPALLRSKIVRGNGRHGHAEPQPEPERDRDHQEPLSEPPRAEHSQPPAAGLFGALEAAIRAAKPDDDE